MNYGNVFPAAGGGGSTKDGKESSSGTGGGIQPAKAEVEPTFPGGHTKINFDQLMSIIKDSCEDREKADNYLVYAFSMFDREK